MMTKEHCKIWEESSVIFNLVVDKGEQGYEDIGEICVLPFKHGFVRTNELYLYINEFIKSSWQLYNSSQNYKPILVDYVRWHNENYTKVKIGFVWTNEIPNK